MKKPAFLLTILFLLSCLAGCAQQADHQIVATTLPVYDLTAQLCEGTELSVGRLVTENVSCLHDYSLDVRQMRWIESADAVVISGAGLEDFMDDALQSSNTVIDASANTYIHEMESQHSHDQAVDHHHEHDPHIWLSPANAKIMAENICSGLCALYPSDSKVFQNNLTALQLRLDALQSYGEQTLSELSVSELITFHDGFAYFAESFDLTIVKAVEEEAGSEASAAELIELICLVREHRLPAIFTEVSGSTSGAMIVAEETGIPVLPLDMAMAGDSYFDAMYHNIDTIKEAMG